MDGDADDKLLPVIVWIHGGAYRAGQALEYFPGRFMEEDVVLVVIQYRLGPLGLHWLSHFTTVSVSLIYLLVCFFLNSFRFSVI